MPTSEYTPTVDDVAALLRARTRDDVGVEVGTFNEDTSPTADEVTNLIALAVGSVSSAVGADIPDAADRDDGGDVDAHRDAAKTLVSLKAAMLIELSYYPEQIDADRSPYNAYKDIYDENRAALLEAVLEARGGSSDGGAASGEGTSLPSYSFPEDQGGMIGWGTVW